MLSFRENSQEASQSIQDIDLSPLQRKISSPTRSPVVLASMLKQTNIKNQNQTCNDELIASLNKLTLPSQTGYSTSKIVDQDQLSSISNQSA